MRHKPNHTVVIVLAALGLTSLIWLAQLWASTTQNSPQIPTADFAQFGANRPTATPWDFFTRQQTESAVGQPEQPTATPRPTSTPGPSCNDGIIINDGVGQMTTIEGQPAIIFRIHNQTDRPIFITFVDFNWSYYYLTSDNSLAFARYDGYEFANNVNQGFASSPSIFSGFRLYHGPNSDLEVVFQFTNPDPNWQLDYSPNEFGLRIGFQFSDNSICDLQTIVTVIDCQTILFVDETVVVEAEAFYASHRGSDLFGQHQWVVIDEFSTTNPANGGLAIQAFPNLGSNAGQDIWGAPYVYYKIRFPAAGDYYIYARGWSPPDANHDASVHFGLNYVPMTTISEQGLGGFISDAFTWQRWEGGVISVPSPGVHNLFLYMRTDGSVIDTFALSTNPNAVGEPNTLPYGNLGGPSPLPNFCTD